MQWPLRKFVKRHSWSTLVFVAAILGCSAPAQTNDSNVFPLLTIRGENLTNATIWTVTPSYAVIYHRNGAKRVPLADLPEFLQKRYGYDPAKAQAFDAAEQERQKADAAKLQQLRLALEKAQREADWPEWRGPNRNGSGVSSVPLAGSWPANGPRKIWVTTAFPSGGASSPAIANGRVYVHIHNREGKQDTIACLDEATGATLWRRDLDVPCRTSHEASATPCITKGRCLVMGARLCYCLDALNGSVFWMSKKGDYSTDPSLTGFNQEISSSVAVVSDVAVIQAGAVFGYDFATGTLRWQAPNPLGYACAMATPVPFSDDRIIYGGRDQLNCLQAKTGKILWKLPGASARLYAYAITPVISNDILLALSKGQLRAFDLGSATPRELWHILYGDPYSTPVADAECCYMIDPGFTYTDGVGHSNGPASYAVVCRDLRTGRVLWQTPIPESQYTSPILVSGKVFVLTDGCRVIKMLDARDGRVLASAPVAACDWSSPSVAHGKLFVRIRHGVACYDLRPQ